MLPACGLTCHWSALIRRPHQQEEPPSSSPSLHEASFHGLLKQCAEDFIVVEIDPSGHRVDEPNYLFPSAAAARPAAVQEEEEAEQLLLMVQTPITITPDDTMALQASLASLRQTLYGVSEEDGIVNWLTSQYSAEDAYYLLSRLLPKGVLSATATSAASTDQSSASPRLSQSSLIHLPFLAPAEGRSCDGAGRTASSPPLRLAKSERLRLHLTVRANAWLRQSEVREAEGGIAVNLDPSLLLIALLLGKRAARYVADWALHRLQQHSSSDDAERAGDVSQRPAPAPPSSFTCPVASPPPVLCSEAEEEDKLYRRALHSVFQRHFPFISYRVKNGTAFLSVSNNTQHSRHTAIKREREEYVHAVIEKRNVDTFQMKTTLAEYFPKLESTAVCLAGMKDRRAVTFQRCSFPTSAFDKKGLSAPLRIQLSTPTAAIDGEEVTVVAVDSRPQPCPIQLGELSGNAFEVTLREVRAATFREGDDTTAVAGAAPITEEEAHAVVEELRRRLLLAYTSGFLNYFGPQRFSESVRTLTEHTGVFLFVKDWEAAVRSIYRPCMDFYMQFPHNMEARFAPANSRDAQVMTAALRYTVKTHFSVAALALDAVMDVQQGSSLWRSICEVAMVERVPYALRSMWVHAAQSLFFNQTASLLLTAVRKRVMEVAADEERVKALLATVASLQLPVCGCRQPRLAAADFFFYTTTATGDEATGTEADSSTSLREESEREVLRLVEQAMEAALNGMGYSVTGAPDEKEEACPPQEGESLGAATLGPLTRHYLREKQVCGVPIGQCWRRLVVKPTDTSITSSWKEASTSAAGVEGGSSLAVTIRFSLPSSSYATCLLRELCLCDLV